MTKGHKIRPLQPLEETRGLGGWEGTPCKTNINVEIHKPEIRNPQKATSEITGFNLYPGSVESLVNFAQSGDVVFSVSDMISPLKPPPSSVLFAAGWPTS